MGNSRIKNIAERVEQFKKFYKKENENILLGFFWGSEYPVHRYESASQIPENKQLHPFHFRVEDYLNDYDQLFEKHEECGGDFIWAASAFWGIPWVEAALGCPVILSSRTSGSIHAEPIPGFTGPESIPDFSEDNPWVKKMVCFLEKAAERSNGRYPLATTRMRGISDLLSLLYGVENLIFAMLEKPDEINAVAERLTDFWIKLAKCQLDHIPDFHGGIGSFYYNAWAPKGTVWHQEDAAATLSPEFYEKFIKKWDEKILAELKGCIMHQHSNGYFPYEHYVNMDFTALELHIDTGGPDAASLKQVYERIQENTPLIIWGEIPETDLDWIFNNLDQKGLAVITVVNSQKEAEQIWNKYMC